MGVKGFDHVLLFHLAFIRALVPESGFNADFLTVCLFLQLDHVCTVPHASLLTFRSRQSRWYHTAPLRDLITLSNGYSHLSEQTFVKHLLYVRHCKALGQKAGEIDLVPDLGEHTVVEVGKEAVTMQQKCL